MRHFLVDSKFIEHTEPVDDATIETPTECVCHRCGGRDFRRTMAWWNVLILHWLINPGLAVNEVFLGQRIPSRILTCRRCMGMASQFCQCPGCSRFHHLKIWEKVPFGNWLGLVCPDCGVSIPCYKNFTSRILLFLALPFRRTIMWLIGEQIRLRAQQRTVLSRKVYYSDAA